MALSWSNAEPFVTGYEINFSKAGDPEATPPTPNVSLVVESPSFADDAEVEAYVNYLIDVFGGGSAHIVKRYSFLEANVPPLW